MYKPSMSSKLAGGTPIKGSGSHSRAPDLCWPSPLSGLSAQSQSSAAPSYTCKFWPQCTARTSWPKLQHLQTISTNLSWLRVAPGAVPAAPAREDGGAGRGGGGAALPGRGPQGSQRAAAEAAGGCRAPEPHALLRLRPAGCPAGFSLPALPLPGHSFGGPSPAGRLLRVQPRIPQH